MYLSEELRKKIKDLLDNGGVISFVTDTVWGLGALPSSEKGVKKIYDIKKREAKKPLILMSNKIENLLPYVKPLNDKAKELIDKHFPGALTLVSEKSEETPNYITSGFDTVGIRIPDNKVFQEICEATPGGVLATTSANLSNEPSAKTYEQAVENMGEKVDLIIEDFGQTANGTESTVASVLNNKVKILRQGILKVIK
ncbi:MAG: L-threonylcarbamoyladenylate synthase [Candidatus Gastranaerophilales bacterium]|nr:L-threonylcarbamoyladenylate synthase [Candidatus Gastranaerophilales bacterium]